MESPKRKPNFNGINVLIADADNCLATAVMHCLKALGFNSINSVRSSDDAIHAVRSQASNLLITEWDIKGSNGIELVRYLRRDAGSPNRTIPIIMLTGRGELHDVQSARDVGITEFLVKPFSTKSLVNRLERIIDQPRSFVLSEAYVGPERRRRGEPPAGVSDRRVAKPTQLAKAALASIKNLEFSGPVVLAPDHSLRQSIGGNASLTSLLTPSMLADAQKAIEALENPTLAAIGEDLKLMQTACDSLRTLYSAYQFEQLKECSLAIKSRAGTFGYTMASDVARLLFLFLSTDFIPTNLRHLVVIQKHIDVLKVVLGQQIKVRAGVGEELYVELERLIATQR